ncbi:hypothetical protein NPIL_184631 [Nephila pilipes]|uniref:Uncharacterized protein n=1 Tax=Nephila pilipes TaxID=299642 RepID=A0A8X6QKE8_NEPPI|nr:hypothetical protein NPIL_184631 [Nephila pilipes]
MDNGDKSKETKTDEATTAVARKETDNHFQEPSSKKTELAKTPECKTIEENPRIENEKKDYQNWQMCEVSQSLERLSSVIVVIGKEECSVTSANNDQASISVRRNYVENVWQHSVTQ